eukprot:UN11452
MPFVFRYDLYIFLQRLMKICDFTNFIPHNPNLHESLEKHVDVVWKNKAHTCSAQLPQLSFSKC